MKIDNLRTLEKEELYELAREYQIKGRTEMSREELAEALAAVMLDEEKTMVESQIFDLGTPVIAVGASDKKLCSSIDASKEIKNTKPEEIKREYSPFFDGDPLPEKYGDNKIVLMPKNPQWAFTYWETTPERINSIKAEHGEERVASARPALRVYDVTLVDFNGNNANSYFDIELPEDTGEWFIGGLNPGAAYIVDIGFKTADGAFITAARSGAVSTPRHSVSDNIDEEWMIVEEYFKKLLEKSAAGRIVNGKWIGGMGASGAMLGSSEEMVAVMLKRLFLEKGARREKLLAHIEETMGSLALAMGSISAGSLSVSSLSRGQGETPKVITKGEIPKKNFWLRVGTEMILYGATEPDATVTVMGREIKLRADGTFSFRYNLPVGHYELPVVAVAKDGEQRRELMPVVDRTGPENNTTV